MVDALSYAAMRRRAFTQALRRSLRRWGVFALIGAVAAGAGSNDPLGAAASLPVTLAWPLHHALAVGAGWSVAAWIVVSALAALVPLLLTRRWWSPPRWAEAERALPLDPAALGASDRQVVRWLVLPWHGLTALGLLLPVLAGSPWRPLALACWGMALAGSLWAGHAWLRRLRQAGTAPVRGARPPRPTAAAAAPVLVAGHWRTWWWLPLRRGAARGSARLLLLFGLANPALAAGTAVAPRAAGWWLAALALTALVGTSLLRARISVDWRAWRAAAAAWPLAPARLERQARVVTVLPVLAGVLVLAMALAAWTLGTGAPAPRLAVAAAYALALGGSCWLEAYPPAADAAEQAVRWLLLLALAIALGSEVAP